MTMTVTMFDSLGQIQLCETPGCGQPATSVWSQGVIAGGASAGDHRSCDKHNPWNNVTVALPLNFTSRTLCPRCGK